MSLFNKYKNVPPLTYEERRWLETDRLDKQLAKERSMFSDDETFEDFLDWRTRIKKRNLGYVPEDARLGYLEESEAWVYDYYDEHPDKTPPWRNK